MIGRLAGEVAEVEAGHALIEVGGVGYVVRMGARTLDRLAVGHSAVVQVASRWSESEGPGLYGFLTREERSAFVTLTGVQGVGPKAALSVLDILPPADLAAAVAREDKAAVGRANGVGPKLALRIVVELKGKPLGAGLLASAPIPGAPPTVPPPSSAGEATAALMQLGLAEPLARRAVEAAAARLGADPELGALIKAALQESGR
ncbi:Holliday junction branch migration protein RuvA [soil metagenome]